MPPGACGLRPQNRKGGKIERKRGAAPGKSQPVSCLHHKNHLETNMKPSLFSRCRTSSALSAASLCLALAACGGGGDAPPAPTPTPTPTPSPADVTKTGFATITAGKQTSESGLLDAYAYSEQSGAMVLANWDSAAGSATLTGTLSGTNSFAGFGIRLAAAGNTDPTVSDPALRRTLNAAASTKLYLTLASKTDSKLIVRLQPATLPSSGCAVQALVPVTATPSEYVLNLDTKTFALPSWCDPAKDLSLAQTLPALFAVDVINDTNVAGQHDLTVGNISIGTPAGAAAPVQNPASVTPTPPADTAQLGWEGTQVSDWASNFYAAVGDDSSKTVAQDSALHHSGAASLAVSATQVVDTNCGGCGDIVSSLQISLKRDQSVLDLTGKTLSGHVRIDDAVAGDQIRFDVVDSSYNECQSAYLDYAGTKDSNGWAKLTYVIGNASLAANQNWCNPAFDVTHAKYLRVRIKSAAGRAVHYHLDSIAWN